MAKHSIKIFYSPRDAGDGSCYVKFYKTEEGIEKERTHLEENYEDGFAEDCTSYLTIEFDDQTGEITGNDFSDDDNDE
jgi:hypothetical protein